MNSVVLKAAFVSVLRRSVEAPRLKVPSVPRAFGVVRSALGVMDIGSASGFGPARHEPTPPGLAAPRAANLPVVGLLTTGNQAGQVTLPDTCGFPLRASWTANSRSSPVFQVAKPALAGGRIGSLKRARTG